MQPGLYIVSTPIGNLKDITLRALDVFNSVDIICCEDTRVSRILLSHYNITTTTISYHKYSTPKKVHYILHLLQVGKSVALVSDAGTPLISDPGHGLVTMALEKNISVFSVPGASSVIAALCLSGLSTDSFCFAGFIPKKGRSIFLKRFGNLSMTTIFFETSHRIVETLSLMNKLWPERKASLVREITKKYESCICGNISELLSCAPSLKGEMVLLLEGISFPPPFSDEEIKNFIQHYLEKGFSIKQVAYVLSREKNISSRESYRLALKMN